MSKYATAYEWWIKEHKDMLDWVLDDNGEITIGNVIEALHEYPNCYLTIFNPLSGLVANIPIVSAFR